MHLLRLAVIAAISATGAVSLAGSASSFFQVQITLHTGLPGPTPPVVVAPPDGGGAPLPVNPGEGKPVVPPVVAGPSTPPAGGGAATPSPGTPVAPALPSANPANPAVAVRPPAGGICTSQTLSDAAHATVRVACNTGQFVSIEPAPGRPFAGSHGGAYRFNFGPGLPFASGLAGSSGFHAGSGTVTALRVMNLSGRESPLEMLVSF